MTHIIETIGKWGVKTSPYRNWRRIRPQAGDIVEFGDDMRRYPVSCRHCRINHIDAESGMASIVDGMGSAFLSEDGSLEISGGPFFSVPLESLEPTAELHRARFWNWGDNSPGAAQGVEYHLDRPVFRATEHPDDHAIRYATTEKGARHHDHYRHGDIPDSAKLIRSWESHDGLTAYLFDLRNGVEVQRSDKPAR
jgi:hypothetical protein